MIPIGPLPALGYWYFPGFISGDTALSSVRLFDCFKVTVKTGQHPKSRTAKDASIAGAQLLGQTWFCRHPLVYLPVELEIVGEKK
jgi:hypothetical protein